MKQNTIETAQHQEGQLAFALIAVRALLISHPQRDATVATIHENYEALFARMLAKATPQPFLDGMQRAFSQVLRQPIDQGQPQRP
jgi:hypothetical protein